jgi:hypothetical protein
MSSVRILRGAVLCRARRHTGWPSISKAVQHPCRLCSTRMPSEALIGERVGGGGHRPPDGHFFAVFYVDDAYLASRDPVFLQRAIDLIVELFARVGLKTNVQKTQAMICTPGRIRIQLPSDSYAHMHGGRMSAGEWDSRKVQCLHRKAFMKASSLRPHLASQHVIYQAVDVPEDYLVPRTAVMYQADPKYNGRLPCPIPGCLGEHKDGWMLRRHFRDLHPFDRVIIPKEGYLPRCKWCYMQVNPWYLRHDQTKECQVGMDRRLQRESAITLALALRQDFVIHRNVLE